MMKANYLTIPLAAVLLAVAGWTGATTGDAKEFQNGASSVQQLVEELLVTLHANDKSALQKLRVNEDEYREIIVPGSVKPGETPPHYSSEWMSFLWGSLNERNRHVEQRMLDSLGGKDLALQATTFGPEHQFAGYKTYTKLVVTATGDDGKQVKLELGSVAEVNGRCKFLALARG